MSFHLVHPWALLLLVPVAGVLAWSIRRGGRPGLAGVLAPLSLLLVVLAVAQPELRHDTRPTVLVVDHSASIDATMRARETEWIRAAGGNGCVAPCRVVVAAGNAVLTPPRAVGPRLTPGTDLEAAVRLGLARVPSGGRLVVMSDGQETAGDVLAATATARLRDVRVDVVPLVSRRRDAAVTRLQAPPAVRAGDEVILQATIRSAIRGTATVTLRRDGVSTGRQKVALRAGDNPLPLNVRAPAAGWHDYALTVRLAGDAVPRNDTLATTVRVDRRPRVVVASPSGKSSLAAPLGRRDLDVRTRATADLPADAAGYAGIDTVVLDDVSAPALGTARQRALVAAVRDGGTGLVVLGGPHSFSLGRYASSPLEAALPVTSRIPGNQQRRNVALQLVIDRSGSMLDEAGGYPKIEEARSAARSATRFVAEHEDELGIVAFDATPSIVVPFGRVTSTAQANAINQRIDGLLADGGTNIGAALRLGLKEIGRSTAKDRHLILLTDGRSQTPGDVAAVAQEAKRDGVKVSAIAVGTGADPALRALARVSGGRYYVTENAGDLPRIFAREANRSAQPVRVKGPLAVTVGAPSPIIRSLSGTALPPVRQNVITSARSAAQQTLLIQGRGSRRDPGLAQWQYGLGRVATWTPGVAATWGGTWGSEDGVWEDAVRWVQRPVTLPILSPALAAGSAGPVIVVDPAATAGKPLELATVDGSVSNADDTVTPLRFAQVAPSRYEAPAAGLAAGVHGFAITADGGTATRGLLAVPYDREYLPRPAADGPLGQLAAQTGGAVLRPGDPAALGEVPVQLWAWLAGLGLLTFFAGAILRLTRGRPRRPRGSGRGQAPTSPARRADSKSTSSAGTSVGAAT